MNAVLPTPNDPERQVRAHVHYALASIYVVFLAPVIGWTLLLVDRHAPPSPWKRRLLALTILDTVLVLGLAAASVFGVDLEPAEEEPPRIGVSIDARDPDRAGGAIVERVAEGSPADRAAIEAGDRIVAVDRAPVHSGEELVREIGRTKEGDARSLTVERDDEVLEVAVTPEVGAPTPERPPAALFEPVAEELPAGPDPGRRYVAFAGLVELLLVAGLAVAARRRRASAMPGVAAIAGLLCLTVASAAVLFAFRTTIGVSLGAVLVALLSGSAALLAAGLVALLFVRGAPVRIGRPIGTAKAIALGVLYGTTGALRVGIALGLLVAAFGLPLRTAAEAFALDRSWGPVGLGIFLAATVLVAPLAEEVLFRGVLLPWLARWMRPAWALGWSALVFALGHLYYGLGALLIAHYGLVLGWARLRTGKLWAPIALHALLNGTTAIALLAGSD